MRSWYLVYWTMLCSGESKPREFCVLRGCFTETRTQARAHDHAHAHAHACARARCKSCAVTDNDTATHHRYIMHTWGAWAIIAKAFVLFNLVCQVSTTKHISA